MTVKGMRETKSKKKESPTPAPVDAPPVKENPYTRLMRRIDADRAVADDNKKKQ